MNLICWFINKLLVQKNLLNNLVNFFFFLKSDSCVSFFPNVWFLFCPNEFFSMIITDNCIHIYLMCKLTGCIVRHNTSGQHK